VTRRLWNTSCGALSAGAESQGHDDIVRLLTTNLNEEKAADKKCSTVAPRKGLREAASCRSSLPTPGSAGSQEGIQAVS
jgi:hypothetical protein